MEITESKTKSKYNSQPWAAFMIVIYLMAGLSFITFAQQPIGMVDSLEAGVKDIKEELFKIKDNYYTIIPYGLAGNVGVYIANEKVILVDDQWAILSFRIKEILKTVTDKPISAIINTHFHYDHVDGNRNFAKEKIPIISHVNVYNRLSQDHQLTGAGTQKAHPKDVLPSITYTEILNLQESDETIELIHVKNAHTDGDTFIHFKQGNIYHTGDVFVRYGLPFMDEKNGGDIYGMIDGVNYLIANSNGETRFIPGHGAVCTVKEVTDFRDLLISIRDQVKSLVKRGAPLSKITSEIKIDERIKGIPKPDFIGQVYRMVLNHEKLK